MERHKSNLLQVSSVSSHLLKRNSLNKNIIEQEFSMRVLQTHLIYIYIYIYVYIEFAMIQCKRYQAVNIFLCIAVFSLITLIIHEFTSVGTGIRTVDFRLNQESRRALVSQRSRISANTTRQAKQSEHEITMINYMKS